MTMTKRNGLLWAILAMVVITAASNFLVELMICDWLTWGAFSYPLTFFVSELTNYHYGPKSARRVVYAGFAVGVTLAFVLMNQRIALASSTAFLLGQLLDISVFNRLRRGTWWQAPALASLSASLLDTTLFFSLAFYGEDLPWVSLAIGDFGVKLAMDLCLLLPFRLALWRGNQALLLQDWAK